jgi:hypothetical protein
VLVVVKRVVGISIGLGKWVTGSVTSETKEDTNSSLRARNVGGSTTLGTFVGTDRKKR